MSSFFDELPDYEGGSALTTNKKEEFAPEKEPSLFDSLEDLPESQSAEWSEVAKAVPTVVSGAMNVGIAGTLQAAGEAVPSDALRQATDISPKNYEPGWLVGMLREWGLDSVADAGEVAGEIYTGGKNLVARSPFHGAIQKKAINLALDAIGGEDNSNLPEWMNVPLSPSLAEDMESFRKDQSQQIADTIPENISTGQQVVVDVATSVGISAPILLAMGVTRGRGSDAFKMAVPGAYYYSHTYGSEYGEARDKGLSAYEARRFSNENAMIMTAAELVGVEYINRALRAKWGHGMIKAVAAHAAAEGAGSMASSILMDLNTVDEGISDKDYSQIFWDGLYAAATAAVGGPVQTGTALAFSGTVNAAAAGSAWAAERVAPMWMERRRVEQELQKDNPGLVDEVVARMRAGQEATSDKIVEQVDMSDIVLSGELVEDQKPVSSPYARPEMDPVTQDGWSWTSAESDPDGIVALIEESLGDEIIVSPDGTATAATINEQNRNRQIRRQRADLGLTPDVLRAQARARQKRPVDPIKTLEHRLGTEIVVDEGGRARFATVNEQNTMLAVRQNMMAMGMTPDILRGMNRMSIALEAGQVTQEQHDTVLGQLKDLADWQSGGFVNTDAMVEPTAEAQISNGLDMMPRLKVVSAQPTTAFPKQRAFDLQQHEQKMAETIAEMKAQGQVLTQKSIDLLRIRFEPTDIRDLTTGIYGRGFHRPERRVEIARRAQEWIAQNPKDAAYYIEGDLSNLAGLNKELMPAGADMAYSAMAQIVTNEFQSRGLAVEAIRRGGDELVWVVVGPVSQDGINQAMKAATASIAEYTAKHGLDGITHGKEGEKGAPGTTILLAAGRIMALQDLSPVMTEAMARVEELKVQRHKAYIKDKAKRDKESGSVKRTQRGNAGVGRAQSRAAAGKARRNPPRLRRGAAAGPETAEGVDGKRAAIGAATDPLIQSLGVNAEVVPFAEMPERIRKYAGDRGETFAGLFDPATDTIYLNTDTLTSPEDAVRTLLHEAVGHFGLRQLFSVDGQVDAEAFAGFLDGVYQSNEAAVNDLWQTFADYDPSSIDQRREATEEIIANMAMDMESGPSFESIYQAIIDWLTKAMAKLGGNLPPITVTDLRKILANARQNLEAHAVGQVTGTEAGIFGEDQPVMSRFDVTKTDAFKRWFKGSKIVDDDGSPLVVYHGTGNTESIFDGGFNPDITGQGMDQLGSGFYFTTDPTEARGYETSVTQNIPNEGKKLGGDSSPGTIDVYLNIKKPMIIDGSNINDAGVKLTNSQVARILKYSESAKDPEDSPFGNWFEEYWDGGTKPWMYGSVSKNYAGENLVSLENDFFKNEATNFRRALRDVLGFDGVVQKFDNGKKHVVAWFPEQIKSASQNKGSFDPSVFDIRLSRASVDKSITETPEFKRWFGDSKVVDADGKPLVVYHGTGDRFSVFEPSESGLLGEGIYATTITGTAEQYNGAMGDGPVMELYVSLKNPYLFQVDPNAEEALDFDSPLATALIDILGKDGAGKFLSNADDQARFGSEFTDILKERGYDGVIADFGDGVMDIVAFEPWQVKSATGNRGTFDPENPDIRFQRVSEKKVTTNVLQRAINRANRTGRVGGSALKGIGEFMFFSASSRVADIGTPTAKKLAAMFRTPVTAFDGADSGPDPFLRSGAWTGRFVSELYKSLDPIRGRMGLSRQDNDALVAALRSGKVPIDPKLATAYRRLRTLLNDIHAYAKGAGLDVGFVENYFPRIYDTDKIIARPEEFIQMLVDHDIPGPVARDIMQKIVDEEGVFEARVDQSGRLRDSQGFKPWARAMGASGGRARATAEKARVINVPEEILRNWLVNDVDAVLANYAQGITKRAEYVRTFGANEEILNEMVRDIIVEAEVEEVATTVHDIIDAAYSLADMSQGTYNPIRNMGARRAVRAISSFETVSKLGLVALTSLSEWAIVMGEGGRDAFVPMVKVFGDALNESAATFMKMTTGSRLLPKSEMRQAAEDIGLILPYVLEQKVSNRFAGASGATVTAFMKAVFLSQLTNLQRMVGYHAGLAMIKRHGQWMATGAKGSRSWESRAERLRSMGISPEQAMAFARDGSFADIAGMAAMNLSYRMVQNPRPEDLPIVINDPHFSLFVQFKRFTASISNTLLKRYIEVARYGKTPWDKLQGLITAALATMSAYFATFLRDYVKWGDAGNPYRDEDSVTGRLIESADRSGMLGHGTYLVAMAAPRYGYADSGAKRLFNLLGPAASDLGLIMDIAQDIREDKPDDAAKKMSRLVPIMNVTDVGKTATAEMLETPMTRLADFTLDIQDTLEDTLP